MRTVDQIVQRIATHKKGEVFETAPDGMAFKLGALRVVASWGGGWDHVSVSLANRLPKYEEMKLVKRVCFLPSEWAVEYHAPPSQHVNDYPNCLHLWRPQQEPLPTPPKAFV